MGPITSLHDLWTGLVRQAWIILLVLAIGLPSAYMYAKTRERVFEAAGTLGVEATQSDSGNGGALALSVMRRLDEVEQALFSRENMLALADQYDLFPQAQGEASRVGLVRDSISMERLMDNSQSWRTDVLPYGITISARLEDPQVAVKVVDTLLDQAVAEDTKRAQQHLASVLERRRVVLDYLVGEESRTDQETAQVEDQIAQIRAEQADSLPETIDDQKERLATLQAQLDSIDRERATVEGNRSGVGTELAERRRDMLSQQRAEIQAQVETLQAAVAAAPQVESDLSALNRRLASLQAELEAITAQRTQAAMSQTLAQYDDLARLYVLEPAVTPDTPISRSRSKIALAAGVAVTLFAFGLALAAEILHPGIRNAAQLQRQLGLEPIVVIPYVRAPASARRRMMILGATLGLFILALLAGQMF